MFFVLFILGIVLMSAISQTHKARIEQEIQKKQDKHLHTYEYVNGELECIKCGWNPKKYNKS